MIDDYSDYISLEKCKDGFVYKILARNGTVGVFNKVDSSFTLSRHKFSSNFLFDEFHWDTGEPYGTVKPIKELEQAPVLHDENQKLCYLNTLTKNFEEEFKQFWDNLF
jgi:hypothetical protein